MNKGRGNTKKFKINSNKIYWREIDKQVIIFDKKERRLYELNDTACFIWKQVAKEASIEQILTNLKKNYPDVDRESLGKDLLSFLKDSSERKIIIEAK